MRRATYSDKAKETTTPANTPQMKACIPSHRVGDDVLKLPPIIEDNYNALCRSLAAKGPPKLVRQRNTLVDVVLDLEDQGYNIYGNAPSRNSSILMALDTISGGRYHPKNSAAYSVARSKSSASSNLVPISK